MKSIQAKRKGGTPPAGPMPAKHPGQKHRQIGSFDMKSRSAPQGGRATDHGKK